MGKRPSAALIITTHKAAPMLNRVLEDVACQTHPGEEVIVAEDGQDLETSTVIASWKKAKLPQLKHVWQKHTGYRRSRLLNKAITITTASYIIFLDGDCLIHPKFIEDHITLAEADCFVQGRRAYIHENAVPELLHHKTSLFKLILTRKMTGCFKAIRWPCASVRYDQSAHKILGCNLGIWKQDLLSINGFDEAYVGWGREDSDLAYRLYHSGVRRKMVYGRALAYHLNHPIISRTQLKENQRRLEHTKATRRIKCPNGLDNHLSQYHETLSSTI